MSVFTGSAVAIITPFTANGVNFDTYKKLIDFQIENGTDAILTCGTTGEPSTMSEAEKQDTIKCAIQSVGKRVPVIAGTGGNCTASVIAASKKAQELGADALLVVTPYYNKCTQNGLVAHFKAIADEVDLPMILYNVPPRTGLNILPATLNALAGYKSIVAIKEASGDIAQLTEMTRLCLDRMDFYSGEDAIVVPLLALGGIGVITVAGNVVPDMMHNMVAEYLNGNIAASRELQFKVNPLVAALFCETNPIPVKAALNLMGVCEATVRMPLTPMEEGNLNRLTKEMAALGLI